jgi:Uma2 family endonuclease
MAKTSPRPATYDDLLKAPDHLIAEIVEGELHTSPRPSGRHERAMGGVYSHLRPHFDEGGTPGGWWIAAEPELHLGGDIFVPDVAGWRRDRVPDYSDGPFWEVRPDWVCEVLSPSTARFDRVVKLPKYAQHGIPWAWLVDPALQTLEIYRLAGGQWTIVATHAGDAIVHAEPFDAMALPLASLWLTASAA